MNHSPRILITDDDLFLVCAYRNLLARDVDLKVDLATSPKQAHELMSAHHYDAAFFDLELADPNENGLDLLSCLHETSPETPVLMMSSKDDSLTIGRCLARGATGFASKNENFLPGFAHAVHRLLDPGAGRQAG